MAQPQIRQTVVLEFEQKGLEGIKAMADSTIQSFKEFDDSLKKVGEQGKKTQIQYDKLRNSGKKLDDQQKRTKKQTDQVTGGFFGLTKQTRLLRLSLAVLRSRLLIVAFAFRIIQQAVKKTVGAYAEQIDAELRLQNVLKTTGHSAGLTSVALVRYAKGLSLTARAGDEAIIAGMSLMATFTNISKDIFKDAIDISLDLSEVMGQDLKSSVVQVGKALDDPKRGLTALSRVGVSFSEEQRKQITNFSDMNQKAKAQEIILKALRTQFGGARDNISDASKAFSQLSQAVGDFTESFGAAIEPLIIPLLNAMTSTLRGFDSDFNKTHALMVKAGAEEAQMNEVLNGIARQSLRLIESNNEALFSTHLFREKNINSAMSLINADSELTGAIIAQNENLKDSGEVFTQSIKTLNDYGLATKESISMIKLFEDSQNSLSSTTKDLEQNAMKRLNDSYQAFLDMEGSQGKTFEEFLKKGVTDGLIGIGTAMAALVSRSKDGWNVIKDNATNVFDFNVELLHSYNNLTEAEKERIRAAIANIDANESLKETTKSNIKALTDYQDMVRELANLLGVDLVNGNNKAKLSFKAFADSAIDGAKLIINATNGMTSAQTAQLDGEMAALKASAEFKNSNAKQQADLEENLMKKQASKRNSIAEKEKLSKMATATMSTYTAAAKAYEMGPIIGPILAAIITGMGFAQVQAISSTPIPKFATGGLIGGRRHSQGGTTIEAEQGEFIMSRKAVESVGIENMNRINQGQGTGSVNISFAGNVMSQDFIEDEAIPMIKEAIRRGADIGVS